MTDHFVHWRTTRLGEIIIIQWGRITIPCNTSLNREDTIYANKFCTKKKHRRKHMCDSFTVRMIGWKAVTFENKVLQAFLGSVFIMPCISYQEEIKATLVLFLLISMFDCECWDSQVWTNAWQYLFSFKSNFQLPLLRTQSKISARLLNKLNKIIFSTTLPPSFKTLSCFPCTVITFLYFCKTDTFHIHLHIHTHTLWHTEQSTEKNTVLTFFNYY